MKIFSFLKKPSTPSVFHQYFTKKASPKRKGFLHKPPTVKTRPTTTLQKDYLDAAR
jgi:hypothetical protein